MAIPHWNEEDLKYGVTRQIRDRLRYLMGPCLPLLGFPDIDLMDSTASAAEVLADLLCGSDETLARRTAFRVFEIFRVVDTANRAAVPLVWWPTPCGVMAARLGWDDQPHITTIKPTHATKMLGLNGPDTVSAWVQRGYVAPGEGGRGVDKAAVLERIADRSRGVRGRRAEGLLTPSAWMTDIQTNGIPEPIKPGSLSQPDRSDK